MKGAIFYASRYGSTEQYARWISDATGLPVFNIEDPEADPKRFDYLILGSALIFYRLIFRKWVQAHLNDLKGRAKILFSVSGAGPSPKLDRWVAASIPPDLLSGMEHVALRGRLDHSDLSWWLRQVMWVGSLFNPDPEAGKEERHGFDYMDRSTIAPIIKLIERYQSSEVTA